MSAGPIWQPPDGGDAAKERMRVNQLRALYGLGPADMAAVSQPQKGSLSQKFDEGRDWLADKVSSAILGKPADLSKPAYTSPSVAAPGYRPPWGGPLNIGPTTPPAYHPAAKQTDAALQRAAETSGGLGMVLGGIGAGGPEGMTPGNVAANLGVTGLQALTPQRDDINQGILYPAFHGTTAAFDEYDPRLSQDLGIHFGTLEQAHNILGSPKFGKTIGADYGGYPEGANIRPVNVDMDNPVELPDIFSSPQPVIDTARQFMYETPLRFRTEDADAFYKTAIKLDRIREKAGLFGVTQDEHNLYQEHNKQFWGLLEKTVRDNGYDGVIYRNRVEGPGDSYIALDPRQVTPRFGGPQPPLPQLDPLDRLLGAIKTAAQPQPSAHSHSFGFDAEDLFGPEPDPVLNKPVHLPDSVFDFDEAVTPTTSMTAKALALTSPSSPLQFNGERKQALFHSAKTLDNLNLKAAGEHGLTGIMPDHEHINYSPYLTNDEKRAYSNAKALYNAAIHNTIDESPYTHLKLKSGPGHAQQVMDQLNEGFVPPGGASGFKWVQESPEQSKAKLDELWDLLGYR